MGANRLAAWTACFLVSWPAAAAMLEPASAPPLTLPSPPTTAGLPTAHVTISSFRLTDNSDNDGIADPKETVNLFLTLRNGSGSALTGMVVQIASNDPLVGCIPTPVVAFGSMAVGEIRESSLPLTFQVADVARGEVADDLTATLNVTITADGYQVAPQKVTVDLDLDVAGGLLPNSYFEGFESAGFGSFTTQTLDSGKGGSNGASDGLRCQYNDPDFVNSNSYGRTTCFLSSDTSYDWHVHPTASPDGGRAYLGNNSLHWGMHPTPHPSTDTARLAQLDAVRLTNPINLGWNGVTPQLSFKHQIGIVNCDPDHEIANCVEGAPLDRAVVQVQLASSTGVGVGAWRTIAPFENVYDLQVQDVFSNCSFDPTDDGTDEDDYFDPSDPARRLGPSSTCAPEFTFSRQGAIFWSDTFDPADIHHASDGPGLQGVRGPGTWVETKFDLSRWRGRRLRVRFLVSSLEVPNTNSWREFFGNEVKEADDGWYIDDLRVSNTLVGAATVTVDTVDRPELPNTVWYDDADLDGFGDPATRLEVCSGSPPAGYIADGTDCDDTDPAIHPGVADAICNGVDENCSGTADDEYVPEDTTCGLGVCASSGTTSCVAGAVEDSCTPGPPTSPDDATCNATDEDCSGAADEDYIPQGTTCGVGVCAASGVTACVGGSVQDSCVPGPPASPTDTTCNGVDENCSGAADEGYVSQPTTCGLGVCARNGVTSCVGGTVLDSCVPGLPQAPNDATCDAVDQDCSGAADEDYQSVPDRWVTMNASGPPFARSRHSMVATTPGRFIVWGGVGAAGATQTGAIYDAASNVWGPTSTFTGVPSPRMDHRAVWTGADMYIWGGTLDGTTYLDTGSRWNSNTWTAISTFQAPSARSLHVQVWTGGQMIVWGGRSQLTQTNTGARLSSGSWLPMSTTNAPSARFNATGVWTGSVLVVWGGEALGSPFNTVFNTGAIYNPSSDTWIPISSIGAPAARTRHSAIWTGTRMIIWGGYNGNATYFNDGAAYDPFTNTWGPISSTGAPTAREGHVVAWTGSRMLVWGGWNGGPLGTGGRYDPATNTWTPMVASGPAGHSGTRNGGAAWTNWPFGPSPVLAVWGGETGPSQYTGGGAFYQLDSTCGLGPCLRQGGSICAGGAEFYGCTPGQSQPETCNSVDDNCDGVVDNQVGGNPGTPCLKASKGPGFLVNSSLSWVALPGATSYDVVRGILPTLRSSGGDYTASVDACLGNDLSALTVLEPSDPPEGSGFWHLLRANFSGGPGTYDEGSPRQVGSRDAEIAAAGGACP